MIELALLPQHLQLEPGGLIRATVTLYSSNPTPTAYLLEIQGLDESWYTLSLTNLTVSAAADAQAVLTLHPPLEATQGVHPFELIAICPSDPEESARVEAVLLVEGRAAVAAVVPPTMIAAAAGPATLAGLPRNWVLVGALAAALLLFAGVALAMRTRGSHVARTLTPACASATAGAGVAAVNCNGSPTSTGMPGSNDQLTGTRPDSSPTQAIVASLIGTPHPGAGTLPGASGPGGSVLYLQPGSDGSPQYPPGRGTPDTHHVATLTATATESATTTETPTSTETPTNTETATATGTLTATHTLTTTRTYTPTQTLTPKPEASATSKGTPTPRDTLTPLPTSAPALTSTPATHSTPLPRGTAANSNPTPAEIAVRYGYDILPDRFVLKWQTVNAQAFVVDGQREPLKGQQSYDLQSHTFVLTATGLDGAQSRIAVVALVIVNDCEVRVNGQQATVPTASCLNQHTPDTATPVPPSTAPPTNTAIPPPTNPAPDTQTPGPTAQAGFPTDTLTPVPTATLPFTATPIPSNTPPPTATTIPSSTATATPSETPSFTPTPTATATATLTVTPTPSKTAAPSLTVPAPR